MSFFEENFNQLLPVQILDRFPLCIKCEIANVGYRVLGRNEARGKCRIIDPPVFMIRFFTVRGMRKALKPSMKKRYEPLASDLLA